MAFDPTTHPLLASANGHGPKVNEPIGEVVESSTTHFIAQACELDQAPAFGSFVLVVVDGGRTILGVVADVQTGGIDPGARPIMRGHDDIRDQLIYAENPDLPHVLRTTFLAVVVGFVQGCDVRQYLPPRPPRLHFSVHVAPPEMVRAFTDAGLDYLNVLMGAPDLPTDQVVGANLRAVADARSDDQDFLAEAGRQLARLLRADYPRLSTILRRLVAPA